MGLTLFANNFVPYKVLIVISISKCHSLRFYQPYVGLLACYCVRTSAIVNQPLEKSNDLFLH